LIQVSLVLCFLSCSLLGEQHGVGVAEAIVTIEVAVVDNEEHHRSICVYIEYHGVVVVVVIMCCL
jgi:hypothetical protein